MSLNKLGPAASAVVLLLIFATCAMAQGQFRAGDKVEILNLSQEWVPGTVISSEVWSGKTTYRVELDDRNAPNTLFGHVPSDSIRARNGGAVRQQPRGGNAANNNNDAGLGALLGGLFKHDPPKEHTQPKPGGGKPTPLARAEIGTPVDGYYDKTHGKMRGVIIDTNGNKVKIHYRGCQPNWDEWVDHSQAHVPNTVSAGDPAITFLFARWRLTKVGISSYNTAWGKADGIELSAGGTYTWFQGKGKAPVRGKWETDAKVPGADNGTPFYDGVLVKDAEGQDWKVYKWSVAGYPDGIQVQRLCSAESIVGSRAK